MVHNHDPVAQRHRLGLVVGDVECRDRQPRQQVVQLGPQIVAQARIQRRQRLVQQQDARLDRQGPGQGHALALAARDLVDPALGEMGDAHQLKHPPDPRVALGPGDAAQAQAVADIASHGHVGKQGVGLEHHADAAALDRQRRHILVVEPDAPAGVRPLQPRDQAQQGGLAAARRAEHGQPLARPDLQVQGQQRAGAVGKGLGTIG